jgi:Coenzyme PQQ synthesis protein D (PqqD)
LNETGTRIWQLIGPARDFAQVGQALERDFDVHPEAAVQSVVDLASELVAAQLASVVC